jgi:hypothetical protein
MDILERDRPGAARGLEKMPHAVDGDFFRASPAVDRHIGVIPGRIGSRPDRKQPGGRVAWSIPVHGPGFRQGSDFNHPILPSTEK